MDRFRGAGLAVLLLGLALSGCRPPEDPPRVVVTIKPIHALVAGVMAGAGEPSLLMDGMVSPHTYQLRPSEARRLVRADLVVWVGPPVEGTFPETLGMLPADVRVVQLIETPGLRLLEARAPGIHSADQGDPHERHDHLGPDPHIWLDPANAVVLTDAIVTELSGLYPENADLFRRNGAAQVERLQALDRDIRRILTPVAGVPFITFHDAFQYFETAYGLSSVASIAISPDRAPGGRTILDLRRAIAAQQVVCVFAEPQFEPQVIATLLDGTGARAGTLDPLGGDGPGGMDAYDGLMRGLAEDVRACLGGDAAP